jgi:hypothetical protein
MMVVDSHDSKAQADADNHLLLLLHLEFVEKHPWKDGKEEIHKDTKACARLVVSSSSYIQISEKSLLTAQKNCPRHRLDDATSFDTRVVNALRW